MLENGTVVLNYMFGGWETPVILELIFVAIELNTCGMLPSLLLVLLIIFWKGLNLNCPSLAESNGFYDILISI